MPLDAANGAASFQCIVADLTPPWLHDRRHDWQDCGESRWDRAGAQSDSARDVPDGGRGGDGRRTQSLSTAHSRLEGDANDLPTTVIVIASMGRAGDMECA